MQPSPNIHLPSLTLLAISILIAVAGQYLFKAGVEKSTISNQSLWIMLFQPMLLAGFAAYMISACIYVLALKHIPLSVAYPSIAFGYVLVSLVGYFFLGETLGTNKMLGIAMISGGVILLWK